MRPTALASLRKRAAIESTASASPSSSLWIVLIGTGRWMCGSKPLYTVPIEPLPRTSEMTYLPMRSGVVMAGSQASSGVEHLHGVGEARAHPPERLGQRADLVLRGGLELGRLELA